MESLTAGMSTGEGLEAVLEYVLVGVCADSGADEYPRWVEDLSNRIDSVLPDSRQVWLASR